MSPRENPDPPRSFRIAASGESQGITGSRSVLPGTGRDPLVRIDNTPDADGGEVVGQLQLFDEAAVGAMNVAIHLLESPESLAYLLEAAGGVALERYGVILDERTASAG